MEGYEEATYVFSNWLKDVANIRMSPKVTLADMRSVNQGRCLLATQNIEKKEILFEIPRSTILNVSTSQLIKMYPQMKRRLLNELGQWEGLIICTLYEMKVLRENSHWWEYFQVLPRPDDINSLMYWTDEQLEGLKPSLIVERIGKLEAKIMYQNILRYVEEFGEIFSDELGEITWADFVYVASIIMSYSFDVEVADSQKHSLIGEDSDDSSTDISNDRYMKSMIPLADTLNADSRRCNANLIYDIKSLKMCALKPIAAGEQIYNIYGDHPNSELLRRYGYVEWDGSKYDFGELPLTTIAHVIQEEFYINKDFFTFLLEILKESKQISNILQGENIILNAYDCFMDGHILPECVVLLQILCILLRKPDLSGLPKHDIEMQLQRSVKESMRLVENGYVTKNCVRLWENSIDARLKEYPSHAYREISPDHERIPDIECLRQTMTERVLQSEVESLQNCFMSMERNFRVIDDSRLLDNNLKRKLPEKLQKTSKKTKQ